MCLSILLVGTAAIAQDLPWPVRLRHDLDRVAQIEWRLRDAAGDRCPASVPDIGVVFDDSTAYDARDRDFLKQTIGLDSDPVIAGVAHDGPAARAGVLPGDVVVSINAVAGSEIVRTRAAGELAPDSLLQAIATSPADRPVALVLARDGIRREVAILPVRHCAIRVVLETDRAIDAHSDDRNVSVSTGLVTYASTDDELAFAAAHEFGHVMNGHRKTSSIAKRRAMEDVADVAGARLVVTAGYNLDRGLDLFRKLARRDVLAFLRAPTHRKYGARIKLIREALGMSACSDC